MSVSILGALVMILYYIAVVSVGVWSGRKVHGDLSHNYSSGRRKGEYKPDNDEYLLRLFLANRNVPLALGIISMTATWVCGVFINGTAEAVFRRGIIWCQAPFGHALSLMVGEWTRPLVLPRAACPRSSYCTL
ncbi:high-affinity choline transporter 1-like [Amblyomma americanum]